MKSMTAGRVVSLFLIALAAMLVAGAASAGVELFEGESATRATSRYRVVAGSVRAVSANPGVATVGRPTGDNARVTITGVKEGTTTVKVTGKVVVINVGVNPQQVGTEKPFETFIDVTVKKPGGFVRILVMKKNQVATVNLPKNMRMTGKLTNSNRSVARAHRNTNRKITVNAKKKGTTTLTTKIKVTEKGKTTTVQGLIEVEVQDELAKTKDKKIKMGWDDLFIGRIVIVNGGEGEIKKIERKKTAEKKKQPETNQPRTNRAEAPRRSPTLGALRSFRASLDSREQASVYVPDSYEEPGMEAPGPQNADSMLSGLMAAREQRHQRGRDYRETGTDTGIFRETGDNTGVFRETGTDTGIFRETGDSTGVFRETGTDTGIFRRNTGVQAPVRGVARDSGAYRYEVESRVGRPQNHMVSVPAGQPSEPGY